MGPPALLEQRAALDLHADEVAVGDAAGVAAELVGSAIRVAGAGGRGELGVGRQEIGAGDLARSGRLDASGWVSHRMALDDFAEALEVAENRPPGTVRVVVECA